MDQVAYFQEKARQCRRLARVTNDDRTIEGLTALAEEFDAKAKAAEAAGRTIDLLGDGAPWRIVSGDDPR